MKKLLILVIPVLVITAFGSFAFILFNNIYINEGNFKDHGDVALVGNIDETEQVLKITSEVGDLVEDWNHTYRVMAHALGGIGDYDYTNSLEAFYQNYNEGTRLFEIDLDTTSEGDICLIHTWEDFRNKLTDIG